MQKWDRTTYRATRLTLALALFIPSVLQADDLSKYHVVARTGDLGIERIDREVSVNDLGTVAFVGRFSEPGTGVEIGHIFVGYGTPGSLVDISPSISSFRDTAIDPRVQINNLEQVLIRRIQFIPAPLGPIPVSYIETWNASLVDGRTTLVYGEALLGNVDGLYPDPSINNDGGIVFTGLNGGTDIIGTLTSEGGWIADLLAEHPRPMIADDNRFVMRLGTDRIIVFPPRFFPYTRVAGPQEGFAAVGRMPGISDVGDDHRLVAFYGDLGAGTTLADQLGPGPGIFVHRSGETFRVAGLAENNHLDPGEWFRDENNDTEFEAHDELDYGPFSGFLPDHRVCVNNRGYVLYLATDAEGHTGLFLSRLNPEGASVPVTEPMRIVTQGDVLEGLDGQITDLELYDSLGNRGVPGDIAFWCRTSTGIEAVVRAEIIRPPVIFVPGIGGTHLRNTDDDLVWFSLRTFNPFFLDDLDINNRVNVDDVVRDVRIAGFRAMIIYDDLISMLRDEVGYREFPVGLNPGTDDSLDSERPEFFVFPYDWRLSNVDTAEALRVFIVDVTMAYRRMYDDPEPDVPVDIIAHSMGGLVARRYILDNEPEQVVRRLVTIGTPFLGAAKVPMIMETGEWFDGIPGFFMSEGVIRDLIRGFQGAHELISSRAYYDIGAVAPFVESGWDINGNGIDVETYTYDQLRDFLNARYPRTMPGNAAEQFHTLRQDDWRGDTSGPDLLHIVGLQAREKTIDIVRAGIPVSIFGRQIFVRDRMTVEEHRGDGTVPIVSAKRNGPAGNLNAPDATVCTYLGKVDDDEDTDTDHLVEHNGLTRNPIVHDNIRYFLRTGVALPCVEPVGTGAPSFYVRMTGIQNEPVLRDDLGNMTAFSGEGGQEIPDARRVRAGTHSFDFSLVGRHTYSIEFVAPAEPFWIEILIGASRTEPNEAVRYLDVTLPNGTPVLLTIGPGIALEYDGDGNGSYESLQLPTFQAANAAAADIDPPEIVAVRRVTHRAGEMVEVELDVRDAENGVAEVFYSVDGVEADPYTEPLNLDPTTVPAVYAFATDNIGNRSSLRTFYIGFEPGDCDGSGTVELREFGSLIRCLDGPGGAVRDGCSCFDVDGDRDIDLGDYARLRVTEH